jgi:hypothetical protein
LFVVAGTLGGFAQRNAVVPSCASERDGVAEAGFACGCADVDESSVLKGFCAVLMISIAFIERFSGL